MYWFWWSFPSFVERKYGVVCDLRVQLDVSELQNRVNILTRWILSLPSVFRAAKIGNHRTWGTFFLTLLWSYLNVTDDTLSRKPLCLDNVVGSSKWNWSLCDVYCKDLVSCPLHEGLEACLVLQVCLLLRHFFYFLRKWV